MMRGLPIVLTPMLFLAACGGESGGGNTPTPPTNTNRAPVFTSAATSSIIEGTSGVPYIATATDADGNALTFTISGGADRAQFSISAGGSLSFNSIPRFATPTDADRNNVYLVQLAVSDGTATTTLDVSITVTQISAGAFKVRRVSAAFSAPLYLTALPDGTGRVLVVQQGGLVRILTPSTGAIAATPFLDVSTSVSTAGEGGLLGIALAPDFTSSGLVYAYMINSAGSIEIRKFTTVAGNRDRVDPATSDVILTIAHPGYTNHYGGWIDFGPDGNLYLGVGDGGGGGDPDGNGQNVNALLGKMLRIDPSRDAYPADANRDYAIPATNPFATSGGAPEIWMTGMRNPFRSSFDRTTGNLYIGDVGQNLIEEIDLVPAGTNGLNFGWNRREGSQPYNGGANSAAFTPPVAEYGHGSGALQGNSITGGYVYRGPVTTLRGLYIFGDFVNANIWSVPVSQFALGQTQASSAFTAQRTAFAPDAGTFTNISSFGTDQSNNLYIVDYDGEIFVIEPA
jgi:glucose/arabinose dehydrogenase